ncbi:unnamed protein product [Blepharisma stoltei]|uniref:Kinesin motor domain-containing protein n=1 Tax=Blepharisma stoltei TaxID=1481888 RepID=A0AAU9K6V8_9CILI|nr:unnamed protein product [Blepharisma stoltei]
MTQPNPNITILCRIRSSPIEKSCIVPYPDSKSIITSQSPLKQLRPSDLKDPIKLNSLRSTLLEDSQMLKFDSVIHSDISQSKLFSDWVEKSIVQMIAGRNVCILACGISGSGKSHTLRGDDGNNRGIIIRSTETLLNQIKQNNLYLQVKFSAVALNGDFLADLMNGMEMTISNMNDLATCIRAAIMNRNSFADKENKGKIHFIISLKVYQGNQAISRADFLEFAGSEFVKEDKSIARALNSISNMLTDNFENIRENALINYIKDTLDVYHSNTNPSKVILICCASPLPRHYKDSLPILKFISRIKECINEKKMILNMSNEKESRKQIEMLTEEIKKLNLEKNELEEKYNEEIKKMQNQHSEEKEKLLCFIKQNSKKNNIENESTGLFSEIINIDENHSFKRVLDSRIEESPIKQESPVSYRLKHRSNSSKVTQIKTKDLADLQHQLEKQNFLLKEKDKFIEEMKVIRNSTPDVISKRNSYQLEERENDAENLKKKLKMTEEIYSKKISLMAAQLLKYQQITKELNIELQNVKNEKIELSKELTSLHESLQIFEEKYLKLNHQSKLNYNCENFEEYLRQPLDDIQIMVKNLIELLKNAEKFLPSQDVNFFLSKFNYMKQNARIEIEKTKHLLQNSQELIQKSPDCLDNFSFSSVKNDKPEEYPLTISCILDILIKIDNKLTKEKEIKEKIKEESTVFDKSQNLENKSQRLEIVYLMNQLSNCIKENRSKEDHIQRLLVSLNSLESDSHSFKAILSDYEDLVNELKQCISNLSIKLEENHAKIAQLSEEKINLENKLNNLVNEQDANAKRFYQYRLENDSAEQKNESISAEIDTMRMQISDLVLINNHLLIEKNELKEEIDRLNKPFKFYKAHITKIENYFENLKEIQEKSKLVVTEEIFKG